MIHQRYIDFTNAEIVERDPLHRQLGELADFLWTSDLIHAEGKFDMRNVASGWDRYEEDAAKALNRCGTAACACGWEIYRSGDKRLYAKAGLRLGRKATIWMFGSDWVDIDNSPFGASYRIDHYLKHRDVSLYRDHHRANMTKHYPPNAFWMEAA